MAQIDDELAAAKQRAANARTQIDRLMALPPDDPENDPKKIAVFQAEEDKANTIVKDLVLKMTPPQAAPAPARMTDAPVSGSLADIQVQQAAQREQNAKDALAQREKDFQVTQQHHDELMRIMQENAAGRISTIQANQALDKLKAQIDQEKADNLADKQRTQETETARHNAATEAATAATNDTALRGQDLQAATALTRDIGSNFMPLADAQQIGNIATSGSFHPPAFNPVGMDITGLVAQALAKYSPLAQAHLAVRAGVTPSAPSTSVPYTPNPNIGASNAGNDTAPTADVAPGLTAYLQANPQNIYSAPAVAA